jgi:hypothetical protein
MIRWRISSAMRLSPSGALADFGPGPYNLAPQHTRKHVPGAPAHLRVVVAQNYREPLRDRGVAF